MSSAATATVTAEDRLLDAACRQARLIGARGVVVVAPSDPAFGARPELIGAAVRDGGPPESAAADLEAAFGADLASSAVVYLGCRSAGGDSGALDREMRAVRRVAGAVIAIEPEPAPGASRWVDPDGRGMRCLLGLGERAALDPPALRVAIADHQGKSRGLIDALVSLGHAMVDDPASADAVLIDHDVPFHGRLPMVEACVAAGGRAFLYPHGADAANMASWDGLYPISPLLSGALVLAEGHAEVARRFRYPHPVSVVGWPYCALGERRRRPVRRVLFAPSHPPYLGNPRYPARNAEIFRRLLEAPVELTVRHIGSLEENGLREAPGVRFVRGDMEDAPGQLAQIDEADAVVADRSTFGTLAVARGATAVLWDSAIVTNNDASLRPANLDRYADLIRYPFDADDGDIWETLRAAAEDEVLVAEWRERFIGAPLRAEVLEAALRGGAAPSTA